MIGQEATMAEAVARAGVDRSAIVRIRQVAKDGALAALAASKPGAASKARDAELAAANAEIARLWEAVKELAVKLTLVEGKAVGTMWPGPQACRCGHKVRVAGPGRWCARGGMDGA